MDEKPQDRSQQHLANQRTFLAWLRSCIVLIGLGFVIAKFNIFLSEIGTLTNSAAQPQTSDSASLLLGLGVVAFGILLLVYALRNYLVGYREISSGYHIPQNSIVYVSTIGVVAFAVAIIAYLVLRAFQ